MSEIRFKNQPIHTNGSLPQIGSKAPDFVLIDPDLNAKSLKDFHGKKKLISIVPSLDTGVCLLSAKKFNEAVKKNPQLCVLCVSCDLPFAQKRVCGLEKLEGIIPLSLMRTKDFAWDYGVMLEDGPLQGLCARAIVALNEKDEVIYTELVREITDEPDYDKALKALHAQA